MRGADAVSAEEARELLARLARAGVDDRGAARSRESRQQRLLAVILGLDRVDGVAEIRPDEFREFVFIPFFILRFIAFAVLATLVARMPIAAIGYIDFALFGGVMMFDFHTWLTRFGQGLAQGAPLEIDPFTPKFFGTTEIGQFTVDSYPALGGALMIAAGTLGPILLVYELWRRRLAAST